MKAIISGILIIAVTLLAGWLTVGMPIQTWYESRDWVETPAYILTADFITHRDSHGASTFNVAARYRYTFSGAEYESTRVSLYRGDDNASSFHDKAYKTLMNYVGTNEPFRCFVNPDQPEQAILFRNIRWGLTFVVGLLVLSFNLAGVALIVITVRQMLGLPERQHYVDANAQEYVDLFKAQYEAAVEKGFISDIQRNASPSGNKPFATKLLQLIWAEIRQRKVAAVLALLLGWLGVHKFYLGKPVQGVLYLFFMWTMIPLILSVIDGIRLLMMSDAAFAKKYC